MTSPNMVADSWVVHALGWTLVHFVWQGALLAALLWTVLHLLSERRAQARYAAGCGTLALMLLAPPATFGRLAAAAYRTSQRAPLPGVETVSGLAVRAGLGGASWITHQLDPAVPWIMLAWMAGSTLFLLRLSVGFGITRQMRRLGLTLPGDELQRIFAELQQRLRLARPVTLMLSMLVEVPTVIGWLRPLVLIPVSGFTGLSPVQIEAILCHELAHIRRYDFLVSVLQSVVEAVLFYHPAVWWVSQQMRRARECCCDDVAVAVGGDALAYARALTVLEAQRSPYPEMALGANGGILTMRIKRLLLPERSSAASQLAASAVLTLLVASTVAIAGSAHAESGQLSSLTPVVAPLVIAPAKVEAPLVVPAAQGLFVKTTAPAVVARHAPSLKTGAPAHVIDEPPAGRAVEPGQSQALPAQPLQVAAGVAAGSVVYKAQPVYPADAKAAHIQGAVQLRALISAEGDVTQLQVISGPEELRASALDAVRQWKYKPYLLNGQPTVVETVVTINYSLGG